jgi:aspartate carbamoyltransferase
MNEFFGKNIISVKDFDRHQFESIFDSVDKIMGMSRSQRSEIAKGMILGYMFFEASTRTRLSFEAAMALIGGTSIGISDIINSSVKKGETLADTVKILSSYVDVLVLRHSLDGSSRFAAEVADKPMINAGSGTEEHPTQTILDLFTIRKEKKKIDGLKIGITGDLKYGRTVYSLLYALRNYDVDVHLISPESLRIRSDTIYDIKNQISYELGMIFAHLISQKKLGVIWTLHLSNLDRINGNRTLSLTWTTGRTNNRQEPDLIAIDENDDFYVIEAKGTLDKCRAETIREALRQVGYVNQINNTTPCRYVSYFLGKRGKPILIKFIDPEERGQINIELDPNKVIEFYYKKLFGILPNERKLEKKNIKGIVFRGFTVRNIFIGLERRIFSYLKDMRTNPENRQKNCEEIKKISRTLKESIKNIMLENEDLSLGADGIIVMRV